MAGRVGSGRDEGGRRSGGARKVGAEDYFQHGKVQLGAMIGRCGAWLSARGR